MDAQRKIEDFSVQLTSLKQQIASTRLIAMILLFTGLSVIVTVPILFRSFPLKSLKDCNNCEQLSTLNFIIDALVIAGGIICFVIAGSKLNTMAGYEKQSLKLNDLTTAIKLLDSLNDKGGEENGTSNKERIIKKYLPSEKDKATQQVITTLLNNYTN